MKLGINSKGHIYANAGEKGVPKPTVLEMVPGITKPALVAEVVQRWNEYAELEAQNARLLEALENIVEAFDTPTYHSGALEETYNLIAAEIPQARAAIEAAKEG